MKHSVVVAVLLTLAGAFCLPAAAFADPPRALPAETLLLEKIHRNPSPLLYAELARLRAEQAALLYRQWESRQNPADLRQALVYADSAARLAPEWDRPWALLGMIHARLRPDEEALELAAEALIRAVEINPANGPAQLLLAQVLMDQGRFWSAIEQYESLFARSEAMITGMNTAPLALCYLLDGRIRAGMDYFDALAAQYPRRAAVLLARAVLYKHGGRQPEAMAMLGAIAGSADAGAEMRKYAGNLLADWKKGAGS
jgi:tetratricopeptide (TPR) repeat protein